MRQALLAEVLRLARRPVGAAELAKAKTQLLTAALLSRQTPEGLASAVAEAAVLQGSAAQVNTDLAALRNVSAADVQRVLQRHVAGAHKVTVAVCRGRTGRAEECSEMSPAGWRSLLASALLLAVGLAGTVAAPAQGFDTPPQPGAPRPLTIAIPFEQRLPNGLRVVLAERRGVQLVSAQLVVLSGSEVDPPRQAGLAELTAGMLAKGTRRRSASALAQAAESLGGAL